MSTGSFVILKRVVHRRYIYNVVSVQIDSPVVFVLFGTRLVQILFINVFQGKKKPMKFGRVHRALLCVHLCNLRFLPSRSSTCVSQWTIHGRRHLWGTFGQPATPFFPSEAGTLGNVLHFSIVLGKPSLLQCVHPVTPIWAAIYIRLTKWSGLYIYISCLTC